MWGNKEVAKEEEEDNAVYRELNDGYVNANANKSVIRMQNMYFANFAVKL